MAKKNAQAASTDDDTPYNIGQIIVDDGTTDDYEEIEGDDVDNSVNTASSKAALATVTDEGNERDTDDFLKHIDYDPDDPNSIGGSN